MSERFIIFYNGGDRPYVHPDHPLTRAEAVNHIKGDYEAFHSVVSFEVGKPSLDVTKGIVAEVIEIWADSGEPLSYKQYEFVELFAGMQVARAFQMEEA
jgi:hypothetical protein